jgi:uncharacterized protein with NRDE domain
MCTLIVLRRPGRRWPLLLAANRDEMAGRPWRGPGRHWPDRAHVVAGMDEEAGGSWLGVNDHGVVAGVLNRAGSLGADPDKRSRGELVLEALDHADARAAAEALADLDGHAYRPFNLVVADNRDAFWLRNGDDNPAGEVESRTIPPGLSMLTAHELNDTASPRIRAHLARFRAAPEPDPETDDWRGWRDLLGSTDFDPADGPTGAMNIETAFGFATLSSSLIALPGPTPRPTAPLWRFASGRPDRVRFVPVDTAPAA